MPRASRACASGPRRRSNASGGRPRTAQAGSSRSDSCAIARRAWARASPTCCSRSVARPTIYSELICLQDNDCVDELVALAPEHLKLSKRKIRIQRCASAAKLEAQRALAAKAAARKTSAAANALAQQASAQPGDRRRKSSKGGAASAKAKRPPPPTLEQRTKAQKLATLAKDDRKAVKSADADRVARRIEKKRTQVVKERKVRRAMAKRVKA